MVAIHVEFDTYYVRTYYVDMNITLSIDEKLAERARKRAGVLGKSLNEYIRESLQRLAGEDEMEARISRFHQLSGTGNPKGWTFNRDELHER